MPNLEHNLMELGVPQDAFPQKKSTAKHNYTIQSTINVAKLEVQCAAKAFRIMATWNAACLDTVAIRTFSWKYHDSPAKAWLEVTKNAGWCQRTPL